MASDGDDGKLSFGERVKSARAAAGYTQASFAEAVSRELGEGKSRQTISAWESGASKPMLDDLPAIARVLGVSIDWLVTGGYKPDKPLLPTPASMPNRQEVAQLAMLIDTPEEERELLREWLSIVAFRWEDDASVAELIYGLHFEFDRFKRLRELHPNATTAQWAEALGAVFIRPGPDDGPRKFKP